MVTVMVVVAGFKTEFKGGATKFKSGFKVAMVMVVVAWFSTGFQGGTKINSCRYSWFPCDLEWFEYV